MPLNMPSEMVEVTEDDLLEASFQHSAWEEDGSVTAKQEMIRLRAHNLALQRGILARQRALMAYTEGIR